MDRQRKIKSVDHGVISSGSGWREGVRRANTRCNGMVHSGKENGNRAAFSVTAADCGRQPKSWLRAKQKRGGMGKLTTQESALRLTNILYLLQFKIKMTSHIRQMES